MAGLKVDVGLQQQRQCRRLRPQVAFDLEAQGVGVHLAGGGLGTHLEGVGENARFVGGDGLVDDALQGREVDVRGAVAGQCRQAVVDHRSTGVGVQGGGTVQQEVVFSSQARSRNTEALSCCRLSTRLSGLPAGCPGRRR